MVLTSEDMPTGFLGVPTNQMERMLQGAPAGATAFALGDLIIGQRVFGMITPYPLRAQQLAFDASAQKIDEAFAASVGADRNLRPLGGFDDIGESRAAMTATSVQGSLSTRWDILSFRRGRIVVLLVVAYPYGDKSAVVLDKTAAVLDDRISRYLVAHP